MKAEGASWESEMDLVKLVKIKSPATKLEEVWKVTDLRYALASRFVYFGNFVFGYFDYFNMMKLVARYFIGTWEKIM